MKTLVLLMFAMAISGCQKQEELPAPQAPDAHSDSKSLATAPTEYLSAAGKAAQSMEKKIDTAAINSALQLFAVEEGRNPETLDELVQKKYLSKLPAPPIGSKLQYDKTAGQVTVVKE